MAFQAERTASTRALKHECASVRENRVWDDFKYLCLLTGRAAIIWHGEDLGDTVLVGQIRSSVLNRLSLRNLLDFQGAISNRQVTKPSGLEKKINLRVTRLLWRHFQPKSTKLGKEGKKALQHLEQKMRSYHERNWDGTASEAGRKSGDCGVLDVKWKKKKAFQWDGGHHVYQIMQVNQVDEDWESNISRCLTSVTLTREFSLYWSKQKFN